jgi:hypothetical protein
MQVATLVLICCLGLLLGCGHEAYYRKGHGDAGQFILQGAMAYGGRIATNGLPALGGDWKYIQDAGGVGLRFPASRYVEVEAFLTSAFGPWSHTTFWVVTNLGATIHLGNNGEDAWVTVHPLYYPVPK